MTDDTNASTTRRGVMKGVGGLAALSMSGATISDAQAAIDGAVPTDPHTRDTYRAIVDAIVPRTPELEDELGPEHVPGGLDVELEKFLIWDFNHFQEIRSEMVADGDLLSGDQKMPRDMFEFDLDATDTDALDALMDLADLDLLDDDLDEQALQNHLTFGPVNRYKVNFENLDTSTKGAARFERFVKTDDEEYHRVLQNYPYASMFTFVFDLVAAEFLAKGNNEDDPAANEEFPGGGTFTRLSREDRLRCLWTIVDGGAVDRLDDLLSPMVTDVGILKYVVMACNGLHGFGYYTEWSGYGETKTNTPNERVMQVDESEVQSRQQSGYPGPADGYAADWRHAVDGGFDDPDVEDLDLSGDLTGDDVVVGGDN
ncbi:hypothetical protein HWV07_13845 [Natronomonas salina]|uniref:hypothetical protein n=1 Tax=Natronomonas salina TaxID=1710540 RepID=UPI0015B6338A|nr:hypothetical protein [Natronomonas salina]QLD90057.1 hypothetical protein HWV07_13845 [Natronomonas salina]